MNFKEFTSEITKQFPKVQWKSFNAIEGKKFSDTTMTAAYTAKAFGLCITYKKYTEGDK